VPGSCLAEGRLGRIDIFVKPLLNIKNYIEINIIDQKTIVKPLLNKKNYIEINTIDQKTIVLIFFY